MTIQQKATIINDKIADSFGGDTLLTDIVANQADPLVNMVTTLLEGQHRVEEKLKFLKSGLFVNDVEGEYLTLLAQLIGVDRRIDQPSRVGIIVAGTDGVRLPANTKLVDSKGNEWTTTKDAVIKGYGYTDAISEIGRYDLSLGELRLKDDVDGVNSATNSHLPILGGEYESDEALRKRMLNIRPQWKTQGTKDALIAKLFEVEGVLDARIIEDLPECVDDCGRVMVGVLGGDDEEVAQAIFDELPIPTDQLVGKTEVPIECDTVKFQRLCPLIIEVRFYISCECEYPIDYEKLSQKIADNLNRDSLKFERLDIGNLCGLYDIVKIEFKAKPIELGDISEDCEPLVIENPITGEELLYRTDDPDSFCLVGVDCEEFNDCLTINKWSYPIFLPQYINRADACPCPNAGGGCGC